MGSICSKSNGHAQKAGADTSYRAVCRVLRVLKSRLRPYVDSGEMGGFKRVALRFLDQTNMVSSTGVRDTDRQHP